MKKSTVVERTRTRVALRGALLIAAALTGLAAGPAAAATGSSIGSEPARVVRYDDLNLDSEAGAKALYARLERAAEQVCPTAGVRDLNRLRALQVCQEEAIARAGAQIASPKLAAILEQRRPLG